MKYFFLFLLAAGLALGAYFVGKRSAHDAAPVATPASTERRILY